MHTYDRDAEFLVAEAGGTRRLTSLTFSGAWRRCQIGRIRLILDPRNPNENDEAAASAAAAAAATAAALTAAAGHHESEYSCLSTLMYGDCRPRTGVPSSIRWKMSSLGLTSSGHLYSRNFFLKIISLISFGILYRVIQRRMEFEVVVHPRGNRDSPTLRSKSTHAPIEFPPRPYRCQPTLPSRSWQSGSWGCNGYSQICHDCSEREK